jgi:hypothetical protein
MSAPSLNGRGCHDPSDETFARRKSASRAVSTRVRIRCKSTPIKRLSRLTIRPATMTVSTFPAWAHSTMTPRGLFIGIRLRLSVSMRTTSASLPGVSEPVCAGRPQTGALDGGKLKHVTAHHRQPIDDAILAQARLVDHSSRARRQHAHPAEHVAGDRADNVDRDAPNCLNHLTPDGLHNCSQ